MTIQKGVPVKKKFKKKLKIIFKIWLIILISIDLLIIPIFSVLLISISIYKGINEFMVAGILGILITPYAINERLKSY